MKATGTRRTLGMIFLGLALVAVAMAVYTALARDEGPVGSYVALVAVFVGTAAVLLTTGQARNSNDE